MRPEHAGSPLKRYHMSVSCAFRWLGEQLGLFCPRIQNFQEVPPDLDLAIPQGRMDDPGPKVQGSPHNGDPPLGIHCHACKINVQTMQTAPVLSGRPVQPDPPTHSLKGAFLLATLHPTVAFQHLLAELVTSSNPTHFSGPVMMQERASYTVTK
eukprot:1159783-Pelagomonas_calceolata.AAC.22